LHLNIHNVVLEGDLSYNQEYQKLTRGAFRLTTHDTKNNLRYQIGDISLPSHKRMSYHNAFGIGIEKVFNINRTQKENSTRINAHEFFIEKNSKVEIYINNRYRNTLNLLAGTHQLFDLNLPTGLNRIKLKIIQQGGKIEQIEFDDFSFSEILQKGLLRYGMGLGIESNEYEGNWLYNREKQITSSYILRTTEKN
jgi:outer membrane usher protein